MENKMNFFQCFRSRITSRNRVLSPVREAHTIVNRKFNVKVQIKLPLIAVRDNNASPRNKLIIF